MMSPRHGRVDQSLSLLAWDQDARIDDKGESVKLALAEDVGERLASDSSLDEAFEFCFLACGQETIAISEESRSVETCDMADEQLSLKGSIWDAYGLQAEGDLGADFEEGQGWVCLSTLNAMQERARY